MKAEIVKMTPQLAEKLLKKNTENRKLKRGLQILVNQMKNGEWKENGEAIIIDKNGILKDGQHRLHAVIIANYSYIVPLITDVDSEVMDTIDTGFNRSLGDILELNKFKYSMEVAAAIKKIMLFNSNKFGIQSGLSGMESDKYVSNQRGLNYGLQYKPHLEKLIALSKNMICDKQPIRIFSSTDIALYLYILAGYEYEREHIDFIKRICGINNIEGTAAFWLFKKLASFKKDHISVSAKWKVYAIIKSWNIYVDGDIPVNRLKININNELEKIKKI